MKKKIKNILPNSIFIFLKKTRVLFSLIPAYWYDMQKYLNNSSIISHENSSIKLLSNIIRNYHVLEKGLTMPERRLGFGQDRVKLLIEDCLLYINLYGNDNNQLQHGINVVDEYYSVHLESNLKLSNDLVNLTKRLLESRVLAEKTHQIEISSEAFFINGGSSFDYFSNSRSSIRNYSTVPLPIERILNSLELVRNTPSACNRQTVRTYVFTNREQIKEILKTQGGNRGFGHLADKLVIVTSDVSVFISTAERNQSFIDGGIYAMNLLYALHFNKVAACILNCSHTPQKDRILRDLCGIKESQVFIAMISCGNAPDNLKIANSLRYEIENTNTVIN